MKKKNKENGLNYWKDEKERKRACERGNKKRKKKKRERWGISRGWGNKKTKKKKIEMGDLEGNTLLSPLSTVACLQGNSGNQGVGKRTLVFENCTHQLEQQHMGE